MNDGHMKILFENTVGEEALELSDKVFTNENGDSFKVSVFKYYVSNIKLTRDDETVFTVPESYHLINQSVSGSAAIELHDVPVGNYKSITFLLGVDSLRNVSGAQTGALDVMNGMFWGWDTGYIMAKLEGQYKNQAGAYHSFIYHIGGFKGLNSSLRWFTLPLPEKAVVSFRTPAIHITADVSEWFKTPTKIEFAQYNNIMEPGRGMNVLVDNYMDMFTVSHVVN